MSVLDTLKVVFASAAIALLGNWVGYGISPLVALPGMLILVGFAVAGVLLNHFIKVYVPTIAYIATLALIFTLPYFGFSKAILAYVNKVNFLALATPIIAFASLSMGKDLAAFRQAGWRIVVASLLALFSVFITAAIIAEVILRIQGFPR
ncbi:MAG: DUF340 domain-containing protein [Bacillota bacterium]|nr:DUF340 domain-containing protein [Bacillota bacterium]MDI7250268.1 DUF340 domain-containing protein [Bacillota bacterium]